MDDKTLLTLVEKFGSSDLAELELNDGALHLVLRKAGAGGEGQSLSASPAAAPVRLGLHAKIDETGKSGHDSSGKSSSKTASTEAITSPIVATFYRSAGPDAPAFAEVGKKIKAGETLCILEAMKMMNHLEAEFDCEIVAVQASNGDLVEYGQTLFEVKRI